MYFVKFPNKSLFTMEDEWKPLFYCILHTQTTFLLHKRHDKKEKMISSNNPFYVLFIWIVFLCCLTFDEIGETVLCICTVILARRHSITEF